MGARVRGVFRQGRPGAVKWAQHEVFRFGRTSGLRDSFGLGRLPTLPDRLRRSWGPFPALWAHLPLVRSSLTSGAAAMVPVALRCLSKYGPLGLHWPWRRPSRLGDPASQARATVKGPGRATKGRHRFGRQVTHRGHFPPSPGGPSTAGPPLLQQLHSQQHLLTQLSQNSNDSGVGEPSKWHGNERSGRE